MHAEHGSLEKASNTDSWDKRKEDFLDPMSKLRTKSNLSVTGIINQQSCGVL